MSKTDATNPERLALERVIAIPPYPPGRPISAVAREFGLDPAGIMNPGKLLPSHPACGEGFRPAAPRLPTGTWV